MYYILLNELEKPRFDAHIEGALLNSKGLLVPNIFGNGFSVKDTADKNYSIKVDNHYSKPGKFRDRLSVYVHHCVHLFVVSQKVEYILNEIAPNQVEFYPLTFTSQESLFPNYKIVNILNKIDCINYKDSKVIFEFYDENNIGEGSIHAIESLVLDESLIPPYLSIFLLGGYEEAIIVVHERLRKVIIEHNASGFVFCKAEDFQSY